MWSPWVRWRCCKSSAVAPSFPCNIENPSGPETKGDERRWRKPSERRARRLEARRQKNNPRRQPKWPARLRWHPARPGSQGKILRRCFMRCSNRRATRMAAGIACGNNERPLTVQLKNAVEEEGAKQPANQQQRIRIAATIKVGDGQREETDSARSPEYNLREFEHAGCDCKCAFDGHEEKRGDCDGYNRAEQQLPKRP